MPWPAPVTSATLSRRRPPARLPDPDRSLGAGHGGPPGLIKLRSRDRLAQTHGHTLIIKIEQVRRDLKTARVTRTHVPIDLDPSSRRHQALFSLNRRRSACGPRLIAFR